MTIFHPRDGTNVSRSRSKMVMNFLMLRNITHVRLIENPIPSEILNTAGGPDSAKDISSIAITRDLEEWTAQMDGNLLAVIVEAFGFVKPANSRADTGVPGSTKAFHLEIEIREPMIPGLFFAQTMFSQWVKAPIGWTVRNSQTCQGLLLRLAMGHMKRKLGGKLSFEPKSCTQYWTSLTKTLNDEQNQHDETKVRLTIIRVVGGYMKTVEDVVGLHQPTAQPVETIEPYWIQKFV
ncbi:hypothetical protein DFH08DRAFT_815367 [Mycena albidolilacea]|uniref:Uncharacterized protein n=1 Tax=Mycena albidolilacea TaxID=1033008 RepID=A0AAD7EJA5_9AGAR|nr:hypothetical protein DFH08DRAFT_815367 [Mycena albidolilacea]